MTPNTRALKGQSYCSQRGQILFAQKGQSRVAFPLTFPTHWEIVRLGSICQLIDGTKQEGSQPLLDAKFLRGKVSATLLNKGRYVKKGDQIMLVDGENSGEVFTAPQSGYMGSTFKQLWVSSGLYLPYILAFILFYKDVLRNSKKVRQYHTLIEKSSIILLLAYRHTMNRND